ncbi:uncharacterized protein BT62DRAFT_937318 [Guyanagaster necrorhizus]|uniref:Uncharacterized protein n=1 Tax=Guyanagaster necrorhizus TaxID=856835 RepID=A0A9P8ANX4_9AGAR|nr:uncharacterized protein BT62DRAFT_937318 [Guyanagaster necrorhizus MCA 3950]KAG7441292.1 hypothetical protein BT62DRAFT_937318 [Guyanagaster necrorhizus MCA 3950]
MSSPIFWYHLVHAVLTVHISDIPEPSRSQHDSVIGSVYGPGTKKVDYHWKKEMFVGPGDLDAVCDPSSSQFYIILCEGVTGSPHCRYQYS